MHAFSSFCDAANLSLPPTAAAGQVAAYLARNKKSLSSRNSFFVTYAMRVYFFFFICLCDP